MSHLHYLVYSEAGDSHANEDVVLVRPHPQDAERLLCSLADGMGGQAVGVAAARIALKESLRAAASFPAKELGRHAPWYPILSAADEAVAEDEEAGFCKLVSLCVSAHEVCGASDSVFNTTQARLEAADRLRRGLEVCRLGTDRRPRRQQAGAGTD